MKALFAFVLLILATTAANGQFYRPCSEKGQFFFASPFPTGMETVNLFDQLSALEGQGVTVVKATSPSTQLAVYIEATPDHYFEVDFLPLNPSISAVGITITDSFGNGGSSLSPIRSLAYSLAAAGFIGAASGRSAGVTAGAASIAAGAALGFGLFGPLASATEMCPNSSIVATFYFPSTVTNYTENGVTNCLFPYEKNATSGMCECNSQQLYNYMGQVIAHPCMDGLIECCEGEFCAPYTYGPYNLTRCCPWYSQINPTLRLCCPPTAPYWNGTECLKDSPTSSGRSYDETYEVRHSGQYVADNIPEINVDSPLAAEAAKQYFDKLSMLKTDDLKALVTDKSRAI